MENQYFKTKPRLRSFGRYVCLLISILDFSFFSCEMLFAEDLEASSTNQAFVDITLEKDTEELPSRVKGSLKLMGSVFHEGGDYCFYLPYNDPEFGWRQHSDRRLSFNEPELQKQLYENGYIKIREINGGTVLPSTPEILKIRISTSIEKLDILFESKKPFYQKNAHFALVMESFYPQLLKDCSNENFEKERVFKNEIQYETKVSSLDGFKLLGPKSSSTESNLDTFFYSRGESYFVILPKEYKKFEELKESKTDFFFLSEEMNDLLPTVEKILVSHQKFFGRDFPYHINIVETASLERSDLPGFIFLNRANQGGFRTLENDWLYWMHWSMIHLFSRQWFGALIKPLNPQESWLVEGTADYLTLKVLKTLPGKFNIFRPPSGGGRARFLFTYEDLENLSAAVLARTEPFSRLTNDRFLPVLGARELNPYIPVKQAIGLRYLEGLLSASFMDNFLRKVVERFELQGISPKNLYLLLKELDEEKPANMRPSFLLPQFWREPGWPDFSLKKVSTKASEDGKTWVSTIEYAQLSTYDLPVPLTLVGEDGVRKNLIVASPQGSTATEIVVTDFEPNEVILDKERTTFDLNRYNNSNHFPAFRFFPGNADHLDDDGYNILWFAYPFRRSGEAWQLAVQAAIFRYISSGTFLEFDMELEDKRRLSATFYNSWSFPRYGLESFLSISQSSDGRRILEGRLQRSPVFAAGPTLALGILGRHRETLGDSETRHQTIGLDLNLEPRDRTEQCRYQIRSELEAAPRETSPHFQYERRSFYVSPACHFLLGTDIQLKGFYSSLNDSGPLPPDLLIDPQDERGAGLRIDSTGIKKTRNIYSLKFDLFLPFGFRLPKSTYLIPEQLKWRLYFDFGRDLENTNTYSAAGFGMFLPFGGDISGVGTLSITQFSILVVNFSRVNDDISRKPRVLFGLKGDI